MQIRRLQSGQEDAACQVIECVKYVLDEINDLNADPSCLRSFLAEDRNYFLAAYVYDNPVGFVYGYRLHRIDGLKAMMYLYELGVLAGHRRKGIGRALVEEMKQLAQESGCRKMFLGTSKANTAAMALYRSTGGAEGADGATGFWWNW